MERKTPIGFIDLTSDECGWVRRLVDGTGLEATSRQAWNHDVGDVVGHVGGACAIIDFVLEIGPLFGPSVKCSLTRHTKKPRQLYS